MAERPRPGSAAGLPGSARSLLRVPADAAWDVDALLRSGADALVIGSPDPRSADRAAFLERARAVLHLSKGASGTPARLITVDVGSATADADLDILMPGRPDGVVLSPCRSPAAVQWLGAKLAVGEASCGLPPGSTAILAVVGATAGGLLNLPGYGNASPRLTALLWDASALAADLGANTSSPDIDDTQGPLGFGRVMTLFAARAAGLFAIDTATDEEDLDRLAASCLGARRMGFTGRIAISARQVATVNACFSAKGEHGSDRG